MKQVINIYLTGTVFLLMVLSSCKEKSENTAHYSDTKSINQVDSTSNVFIGKSAGEKNQTGVDNTFLGNHAGMNVISENGLTFLGSESGMNHRKGFANTFVGHQAGQSDSIGYQNTFVGTWSGRENKTGFYNVFVGTGAGYHNVDGIGNVCIGDDVGSGNQHGSGNVLLGTDVFLENEGSRNSGLGRSAATKCLTCNDLIAFGYGAFTYASGEQPDGDYTSNEDSSIAIGNYAGSGSNSKHNFFAGHYSGIHNRTGSKLILLGHNSDVAKPNLASSIGIGNGASVTKNNQLVVGSPDCPIEEIQLGVNSSSSPLLFANKEGIGVGNTSPDYEITLGKEGKKSLHFSADKNPENPPTGSAVIFFDGNDLKVKNSKGVVKVIADF